tara:strand:- start:3521 stop:4789 length:1269 start_codon:yes stop_codon:yes gene_type:complete
MRKKVLITAPILTQSGYGVHARTIYRALKTREDAFDIYVNPINWGNTSWLWEDDEERRTLDLLIGKTQAYIAQKGQFDVNLMVTIPLEWQQYRINGTDVKNIGITAGIESNRVSQSWIQAGNEYVEKIIVPSDFSKKVYEETEYILDTGEKFKLSTPIKVVNYPVKEFTETDLSLELECDFNFLVVAQWGVRKNLENTIRWFVEEFVDREVGLIIKANIVNNSVIDKTHAEKRLQNILSNYPDRKCKVYLLHGYMDNDEVHSLYSHPKIKSLISLTHGEGYGLPLFEAAYCGMPVISHDWGGQTDFLYMPIKDKKTKKEKSKSFYNKVSFDVRPIQEAAVWEGVLEKDSMWAYPEQGSAKMKMREVYRDYSRIKSRAKKLQKYLLKEFSEENIYKQIVSHIIVEEEFEVENWLNSLDVEVHD